MQNVFPSAGFKGGLVKTNSNSTDSGLKELWAPLLGQALLPVAIITNCR